MIPNNKKNNPTFDDFKNIEEQKFANIFLKYLSFRLEKEVSEVEKEKCYLHYQEGNELKEKLDMLVILTKNNDDNSSNNLRRTADEINELIKKENELILKQEETKKRLSEMLFKIFFSYCKASCFGKIIRTLTNYKDTNISQSHIDDNPLHRVVQKTEKTILFIFRRDFSDVRKLEINEKRENFFQEVDSELLLFYNTRPTRDFDYGQNRESSLFNDTRYLIELFLSLTFSEDNLPSFWQTLNKAWKDILEGFREINRYNFYKDFAIWFHKKKVFLFFFEEEIIFFEEFIEKEDLTPEERSFLDKKIRCLRLCLTNWRRESALLDQEFEKEQKKKKKILLVLLKETEHEAGNNKHRIIAPWENRNTEALEVVPKEKSDSLTQNKKDLIILRNYLLRLKESNLAFFNYLKTKINETSKKIISLLCSDSKNYKLSELNQTISCFLQNCVNLEGFLEQTTFLLNSSRQILFEYNTQKEKNIEEIRADFEEINEFYLSTLKKTKKVLNLGKYFIESDQTFSEKDVRLYRFWDGFRYSWKSKEISSFFLKKYYHALCFSTEIKDILKLLIKERKKFLNNKVEENKIETWWKNEFYLLEEIYSLSDQRYFLFKNDLVRQKEFYLGKFHSLKDILKFSHRNARRNAFCLSERKAKELRSRIAQGEEIDDLFSSTSESEGEEELEGKLVEKKEPLTVFSEGHTSNDKKCPNFIFLIPIFVFLFVSGVSLLFILRKIITLLKKR